MWLEWRTLEVGVGKERVKGYAILRGKVWHRLYLQVLGLLGRILLGILGVWLGDGTKWYWTKWYGQNGTDKMPRTKWYQFL